MLKLKTKNSNKTPNLKQIFRISSLPALETELLLAFLLKKEREFILAHPETKLSELNIKNFKILEKKRLKNYPLAYLIKQKGFYGLDFKVSPAVLTPRPESELIVEESIKKIKTLTNKNLTIIDLGTGSGAIVISLAQEIKKLFPALFKNINFIATDISKSALNIARQNAKNYKLNNKIKFYQGNLLEPIESIFAKLITEKTISSKTIEPRIIITANLPYLTPTQIKKAPSVSKEPYLALDGGPDGLKYYQILFKHLAKLKRLAPNSQALKNLLLLNEIDPSQTKKIKILGKKYFPQAKLQIKKDLAGRNRLLLINFS